MYDLHIKKHNTSTHIVSPYRPDNLIRELMRSMNTGDSITIEDEKKHTHLEVHKKNAKEFSIGDSPVGHHFNEAVEVVCSYL